MNYSNLSSKILTTPFLTVLTLMIILAGCSEIPGLSYDDELSEAELGMEQSTILNSNTSFPVFHQVFNHDTEPWATETEGVDELSWCGSIERHDRRSGDLNPTVGRGYATLQHGFCNSYWYEDHDQPFPPVFTSAPATAKNLDLYSTEWPASGFIQQLEIYLDTNYPAGNEEVTFHDVLERDTDFVFS